ncbi:protein kinase domain-containing protein [Terrisporobacter vanillatitrophus]|uniref:protein kinase domain-containing protein n=1 Tax=Terrisporobacter vanillatitrophus TaxID=3058402 RepID=UPI0033677EB7
MKYISNRYVVLDNDEEIVFGKFYKARDLQEDVLVFIQIIKDNKYINEKFLPNLIDESMTLLQINSANIAKILDLGTYYTENERCYYIVSEFFAGIELRKVIKGNYMDLNSIVKISRKILRALDTSYNHRLYHGSLTEDNIFVDENYNVKIYDFGITQANKGVNIRKDNSIGFLCPHQINIDYTDKESDFFSLGVILFDAIFKKMPFGIGKNEGDMLKLIDRGIDWNTVAINTENIALVNMVKKLIRRAEKYNNVKEVLIDLSKFMYVKADIEENSISTLQRYENDNRNNKSQGKFFQKALLLILTLTILVTVIIQSQ